MIHIDDALQVVGEYLKHSGGNFVNVEYSLVEGGETFKFVCIKHSEMVKLTTENRDMKSQLEYLRSVMSYFSSEPALDEHKRNQCEVDMIKIDKLLGKD